MEQEPPFDPAALTDDPEIAALLTFAPVPRKCLRHDGWWPEIQYRFILGVARTGNPDLAAHALGGRTFSGAWKLRKAGGGEGFAAAWDGAKALYFRRNPPERRRKPDAPTGKLPGPGQRRAAGRRAAPGRDEEKERADLFRALMNLYWTKAKAERRCRLEGRIVAADFYVRQMTCIELAADLSENGGRFLAELRRGDVRLERAVATPLSLYFDYLRRGLWVESGEPDRPELPRFGEVHDGVAAAPSAQYSRGRDGLPCADWCRGQDLEAAEAAEAQRLWEEKARADAAQWRARLEREDPDRLAALLAGPELDVDRGEDERGEEERP